MKIKFQLTILCLLTLCSCTLPLYTSISNDQIINLVKTEKAGVDQGGQEQKLKFEMNTKEYYALDLYLTHKNDSGLMKPKYTLKPEKRETITAHHFKMFLGDIIEDKDADVKRQSFVFVSYKSPVQYPDKTEGSTVFLLGDIDLKCDSISHIRYATIRYRSIYAGKKAWIRFRDRKLYSKKKDYELDLALRENSDTLQIIHAIDRKANKIGSDYNLFYDLENLYGFKLDLVKRVN
jgi:hypothetical protein